MRAVSLLVRVGAHAEHGTHQVPLSAISRRTACPGVPTTGTWRSWPKGIPNHEGVAFHLAPAGKPFGAVAVLQLAQQGKLKATTTTSHS